MMPTAACSHGCEKDARGRSVAWWSLTSPLRSTATTASRFRSRGVGVRSSTAIPRSTAAAMSGTRARSGRWTKAQFPRSALLFRPLRQFFSFRSGRVRISAGAPHPLGATWDGRGTNFALAATHLLRLHDVGDDWLDYGAHSPRPRER